MSDEEPVSFTGRLFGYMFAAVFVFAIAGGLYIALSSDSGEASGASHVSRGSGSANRLPPDYRAGREVTLGSVPALARAAEMAGCTLRQNLPPASGHDLDPGQPAGAYSTSPPTSGDYIKLPHQQADGAWLKTPRPAYVVAALRHGRIIVQYSPALDEGDQLQLKGLYDRNYSSALLYPRLDMKYAVAATAWRNLLGCPSFMGVETLRAIKAFGAAHINRAPEEASSYSPLNGPSFSDHIVPDR